MHDKRFRSDRGRDPIAELARLIAQADSHEESAPSHNCSREETVSDETPELPPTPQLTVGRNEHEQGSERDDHCSGVQAHDFDDQPYAVEEECQDNEVPHYAAEEEHQDSEVFHYTAEWECQDNEVPRVRRRGLTLVMAIFGFALVGTACAVGSRVSPMLPPSVKAINERNMMPSVSDPQAASSGNTREVGPATTGSFDNMGSRETQPAKIAPRKTARRGSLPRTGAPTTSTAGQVIPNQAVPRVAVAAGPPAPPATIAATPQSLGQSNSANATATPNHEHLAAAPVAHANASSTAAVTAPVIAIGYAVQVTSERSASKAQAAFRTLQAKYPNQLGGHKPIIRRADLGGAGTYHRALIGPFASAEKAGKLCSGLRAAGGDCVIQKN